MLEIQVKKQLGQLHLSADLEIPAQGVTAIFGRSGSGKSSLINLVAGLSTPDTGRIALRSRALFDSEKGINLAPEKRHVGYVFQDAQLFPHYRVKGNLRYGVKTDDPAHFDRVVELLGLGALLNRYPLTLSGGEKQRVSIGRALLSKPDILLMDEPLSALDLPRKRELLAYLATLSQQFSLPILYVTHAIDELEQLADRVLLLDAGQVVAFAPTEQLWQQSHFQPWLSDNPHRNLLQLPVQTEQPDPHRTALDCAGQTLWISPALNPPRHSMRLRIDSQHLILSRVEPEQNSIENCLRAKLIAIQPQATHHRLQLALGEQPLWADISRASAEKLALKIGETLFVQIQQLKCLR